MVVSEHHRERILGEEVGIKPVSSAALMVTVVGCVDLDPGRRWPGNSYCVHSISSARAGLSDDRFGLSFCVSCRNTTPIFRAGVLWRCLAS